MSLPSLACCFCRSVTLLPPSSTLPLLPPLLLLLLLVLLLLLLLLLPSCMQWNPGVEASRQNSTTWQVQDPSSMFNTHEAIEHACELGRTDAFRLLNCWAVWMKARAASCLIIPAECVGMYRLAQATLVLCARWWWAAACESACESPL
jgi:hypothetical protein